MYLIILSLLLIETSEQASREIKFGEVQTIFNLTEILPVNDSKIYVIQRDRDNPEQYLLGLFSGIVSLKLFDSSANTTRILAGDLLVSGYANGEGLTSRFNGIYGLVQSSLGYIVTDYWNHCLRQITPMSADGGNVIWRASTYAGLCKVSGFINGEKLNARFSLPNGLLEKENILYITDSKNQKIRMLDMDMEEVFDVHVSEINKLGQFVFGAKADEYYVNSHTGILKIEGTKEAWLVGCRAPEYQQLERAQFSAAGFGYLTGISKMNEEFLLVTDAYTVKVVDLNQQVVDVICTGEQSRQDGNVNNCMLHSPTSLTVIDNVILIGEESVIRQIPFSLSNTLDVNVAAENSITSASKSESPEEPELECERPPFISKSWYEQLGAYPIGATVVYQCQDSYTATNISNNRLVCAPVQGDLVWAGKYIECSPSRALFATIILSIVTGISLITLTVVVIKTRATRCGSGTPKSSDSNSPSFRSSHNTQLPNIPTSTVGEFYETVGDRTVSTQYLQPRTKDGRKDDEYICPTGSYDYDDINLT